MLFLSGVTLWLLAQPGTPKFDAGLTLYRSGDCAGATRNFSESETAGENAPGRVLYQGACLATQGRWEPAAKVLAPYAAAHPGEAEAWFWLARVDLHRQRFAEAHDEILKAIALNGTWGNAYRTLGTIELERTNHQAAYRAWLQAYELNKHDDRTTYYLGRLFFEADQFSEATLWLERTLKLAPNQFRAKTYLGVCHVHLNLKESAEKLYREAIAESIRQQKPYSWAFLDLAKLLRESGRDQEALELLQQAEKLCPEAHVLTLLGQMLTSSEPVRAEATLRRAITLDPSIPETHYRMAMLLRNQGKAAEAQTELREFQRLKVISEKNKVNIIAVEKTNPN